MAREKTRLEQADDGQLAQWARDGCREAFGELARRYRTAVRLTARQIIGSAERADDVAQESLLIAFRALPTLAEPDKFGAWLGAITRHRARRVARQESRFVPLESSHFDTFQVPKSPASDDLTEAFAQLGDDYQTVIRLRYWDEWSVGQIAAFLSLPITTIKWRLHHARELLRRHLSQQWKEEKEENDGKLSV